MNKESSDLETVIVSKDDLQLILLRIVADCTHWNPNQWAAVKRLQEAADKGGEGRGK